MRFFLFGTCLFLFCSVALCASAASERLSAAAKSVTSFHTSALPSYGWIQQPNAHFFAGFPTSPSGQGTWSSNGWVNYGSQASEAACKSFCDGDANCWAYTWFDASIGGFAFACFGRQPVTNAWAPHSIIGLAGCWSGYKQITAFGNPFDKLYVGTPIWTPAVDKTKSPNTHFFAGVLGIPGVEYWQLNNGFLELNNVVVTTSSDNSQLVAAQTGGINLGTVLNEDMCAAAVDFILNLSLNNGNPSIIANYYTYVVPSGSIYDNYCFVGSTTATNVQSNCCNSGTRSALPSSITLI